MAQEEHLVPASTKMTRGEKALVKAYAEAERITLSTAIRRLAVTGARRQLAASFPEPTPVSQEQPARQ